MDTLSEVTTYIFQDISWSLTYKSYYPTLDHFVKFMEVYLQLHLGGDIKSFQHFVDEKYILWNFFNDIKLEYHYGIDVFTGINPNITPLLWQRTRETNVLYHLRLRN